MIARGTAALCLTAALLVPTTAWADAASDPQPTPTATATQDATGTPTGSPDSTVTPEPTSTPTDGVTSTPEPDPTDTPSAEPTDSGFRMCDDSGVGGGQVAPGDTPTDNGSDTTTDPGAGAATDEPTSEPTSETSDSPTPDPTDVPTDGPTETPTPDPTDLPCVGADGAYVSNGEAPAFTGGSGSVSSARELPFTGARLPALLLLGTALAGLGAAFVRLGRRRTT